MQNWEYLVLFRAANVNTYNNGPDKKTDWHWEDDLNNKMSYQERLNNLGQQGWELVSATSVVRGHGSGNTTGISIVLKRTI